MPLARSTRSNPVRAATLALGFALVYFLADVSLDRFGISNGWTILWPLNGMTIALLIMRPRSDWPALLLGVEIGTGIAEHLDGNAIGSAVMQRIISLIEVLISALLLPGFATLNLWLRKPRIYPRFLAALFLGPGVSGVLAALYFHSSTGQAYLSAFNDWATADALGIAAVMPLALSLRSPEMAALFRRRAILQTLLTLTVALVCASVVFSVREYPLLFLLFPMLLLVDSLLGFSGAAIAVLTISIYAVFLATHSVGLFGNWSTTLAVPRDLALQIFLGFNMVALFPASILLMERRRMATELQDTNSQLLMLASLDGLTGIANRRSLDERFAREWSGAIRGQTSLALLMIDIDHFKQFNDLYGHHAGDRCLQAVAEALAAGMRRTQDHLARFGGEEFAVLLPHTGTAGAVIIAERLRESVAALAIEHRGSALNQVTISVGCAALTPTLAQESLHLLKMADAALYEAKRAGRNRVKVDSLDMVSSRQ